MCWQPGQNTRLHARLPHCFLGMDDLKTESSFYSQATWVTGVFGSYIFLSLLYLCFVGFDVLIFYRGRTSPTLYIYNISFAIKTFVWSYPCELFRHFNRSKIYNELELYFSHSEVYFTVKDLWSPMGVLQRGQKVKLL